MKWKELSLLFEQDEEKSLPPLGDIGNDKKFDPDQELDIPEDAGIPVNDTEDEKIQKKEKVKKENFSQKSKQERKARDELINKFNRENEESSIKLISFNPDVDNKKDFSMFKVIMILDPEEIFLDKDKYESGNATIYLNQVFTNELRSIAKQLGIDDIKWTQDENGGKYGKINIWTKEEEEEFKEKDQEELEDKSKEAEDRLEKG